MIPVSNKYKEFMKDPVRPQGYARISYGIINTEASNNTLEFSGNVDWANPLLINEFSFVEKTYATFEKNRFKTNLNSSFYIKPKDSSKYNFKENYVSSVVSKKDKTFENNPYIEVVFDEIEKLYGITLTFDKLGNTYPSDFNITIFNEVNDIISYEEIKENNFYQYPYLKEVENAKKIRIEFIKTSTEYQRVRVSNLEYGIYQIFTNKNLDQSKKVQHTREISPVSESLSNSKIIFSIINENDDYNILNPQGLWRYVEENQPVKVEFGLDLVGLGKESDIEWVETDNLILSEEIKATSTSVTFTAQDRFFLLDKIYNSTYREDKISFYDLIVEVLEYNDLNEFQYIIDDRLKNIFTNGLIQSNKSNIILQLIANATNSIVFTDNKGRIVVEVAFDPIITIVDNGHSSLSQTNLLASGLPLTEVEYSTLDKDFMRLSKNSNLILAPYENENNIVVSYISDVICDENGLFSEKNPKLSISYSLPSDIFQYPITFNNVSNEYAIDFNIVFRNDLEVIKEIEVRNNANVIYFLETSVIGVKYIDITILKWSNKGHRAVINGLGQGRINDFYMDFNTSKVKPIIDKTRLVKSLNIAYYEYNVSDEVTSVVIKNNKEYIVEINHQPMKNISVALSSGKIISEKHYSYKSIIEVDTLNIETITLSGNIINIIEQNTIKNYNKTGLEQTHKNPLINDFDRASIVGDWMYDYYSKNNLLKIPYRGNPELEPFDTIYAESQFQKYAPTRIVKSKFIFNGAFDGEVEVIKL